MKHTTHVECPTHPYVVNINFGDQRGHKCDCHVKKCMHVLWNYKVGRTTLKEAQMLELVCTNEEKVQITLNPVTPGGNPIGIENFAVEVQSGDGTFELNDDGSFGFWAISGDGVGDTVFIVTADADLGEGVTNVSDFVKLTVLGAQAAALGLTAGTPVLK